MKKIDISDLVGKPYKANSDGPDAFDCSGLCKEVYRRLGLFFPDVNAPEALPDRDALLRECLPRFEVLREPEPYCLVTFSIIRPYVTHVGVVLPSLISFIHATKATDVVVEKLYSFSWRQRIVHYVRPICS